jgi:thymidylate kinase
MDGQDRFENEKRTFHEAVRAGYLNLAKLETERFIVCDAALNEAQVEMMILAHLEQRISARMREYGR